MTRFRGGCWWSVAVVAALLALLASSGVAEAAAQNESASEGVASASAVVGEEESSRPRERKVYASLSEAQQALRSHLLENYDRGSMPPYVPPEEEELAGANASAGNTTEPVTVEVGINFHRVLEVDVVKSEVDLLTWMRFVWRDTRLSWDPEDYNGLDKVWFWVEDGAGLAETSEIWTPDIELWNQRESIKTSYSNTFASVDSDGSVFWSRPGNLVVVCKFEGLENFPFDNLICVAELGSWSYSGKFLRLGLFSGTGVSIGGSDTSGEAFSEFKLDNATAELIVYPPYPADPLADWPVIKYTISFHRSWQPYIRGYLVSQIIFNVIGFACFWMPVASGERLGLAITSMLSAVAADLVVVSKLPGASELTWLQKFSMVSQVFAAYCVLEGVVVSFFYFQTGSDLIPSYLQCFFNRVKPKAKVERTLSGNSSGDSRLQMMTNPLQDSQDTDDVAVIGRSSSFQPRDADDYRSREEAKNNTKWKQYADGIDNFSRVVLPLGYTVIVGVFLGQVTEKHARTL
ncbi:neurotransmitter-gated ion channel domain-containing protein [Chloropicon primus]|nr:neurotransmitter-gated ion channel domain-containing protein [Chloropicon primus]